MAFFLPSHSALEIRDAERLSYYDEDDDDDEEDDHEDDDDHPSIVWLFDSLTLD